MLLIQRLSALDCQGARLSPPGLGVHYAAPLPARLGSPGTRRRTPTARLRRRLRPCRRAAAPTPSPQGGPGSGHPRPRGGWLHLVPAPVVPEPHLRGDLGAGVPPGLTIWPISGRTSPPPLQRVRLLAGTLPRVPVPVAQTRASRAARCRRQMRVGSLLVPGEEGAESKERAPGEEVAQGERRGQLAAVGQDEAAGGSPNPGAKRSEGEDAAPVPLEALREGGGYAGCGCPWLWGPHNAGLLGPPPRWHGCSSPPLLSGPCHAPTHSPASSQRRPDLSRAQQEHHRHQPGVPRQPHAKLNKATD